MGALGRITAQKISKCGVFSCPYFPVFGLNTVIYLVKLSIHSKYGKIQTRKNTIFGHFLCSEFDQNFILVCQKVKKLEIGLFVRVLEHCTSVKNSYMHKTQERIKS